MQKRLTVKELKAALVDVPDELEVRFGSDTEAKLAWITLKSMETLSRVMISDGR